MNIILTRDVEHVGRTGQTVVVKDGYARNFLIPHGLALPATTGNRSHIERLRAAQIRREEVFKAKALELADRLQKISCTIPVVVGDQGKLHGSVTTGDILQALQAQGIVLDKHQILLEEPISQLGVSQVPVKLHPEVVGVLKVVVAKA